MEKKQTAVEWLLEQVQQQRETGETDLRTTIFYCRQALQMEKEHSREALEAAFKAGWMKANATNYNESYFNHYYDNL